jgi:hypothetical protein
VLAHHSRCARQLRRRHAVRVRVAVVHSQAGSDSWTCFPLTPTLSLGVREHVLPRRDDSSALPIWTRCRRFSLSLRERVGVRGKGACGKKAVEKSEFWPVIHLPAFYSDPQVAS